MKKHAEIDDICLSLLETKLHTVVLVIKNTKVYIFK